MKPFPFAIWPNSIRKSALTELEDMRGGAEKVTGKKLGETPPKIMPIDKPGVPNFGVGFTTQQNGGMAIAPSKPRQLEPNFEDVLRGFNSHMAKLRAQTSGDDSILLKPPIQAMYPSTTNPESNGIAQSVSPRRGFGVHTAKMIAAQMFLEKQEQQGLPENWHLGLASMLQAGGIKPYSWGIQPTTVPEGFSDDSMQSAVKLRRDTTDPKTGLTTSSDEVGPKIRFTPGGFPIYEETGKPVVADTGISEIVNAFPYRVFDPQGKRSYGGSSNHPLIYTNRTHILRDLPLGTPIPGERDQDTLATRIFQAQANAGNSPGTPWFHGRKADFIFGNSQAEQLNPTFEVNPRHLASKNIGPSFYLTESEPVAAWYAQKTAQQEFERDPKRKYTNITSIPRQGDMWKTHVPDHLQIFDPGQTSHPELFDHVGEFFKRLGSTLNLKDSDGKIVMPDWSKEELYANIIDSYSKNFENFDVYTQKRTRTSHEYSLPAFITALIKDIGLIGSGKLSNAQKEFILQQTHKMVEDTYRNNEPFLGGPSPAFSSEKRKYFADNLSKLIFDVLSKPPTGGEIHGYFQKKLKDYMKEHKWETFDSGDNTGHGLSGEIFANILASFGYDGAKSDEAFDDNRLRPNPSNREVAIFPSALHKIGQMKPHVDSEWTTDFHAPLTVKDILANSSPTHTTTTERISRASPSAISSNILGTIGTLLGRGAIFPLLLADRENNEDRDPRIITSDRLVPMPDGSRLQDLYIKYKANPYYAQFPMYTASGEKIGAQWRSDRHANIIPNTQQNAQNAYAKFVAAQKDASAFPKTLAEFLYNLTTVGKRIVPYKSLYNPEKAFYDELNEDSPYKVSPEEQQRLLSLGPITEDTDETRTVFDQWARFLNSFGHNKPSEDLARIISVGTKKSFSSQPFPFAVWPQGLRK